MNDYIYHLNNYNKDYVVYNMYFSENEVEKK